MMEYHVLCHRVGVGWLQWHLDLMDVILIKNPGGDVSHLTNDNLFAIADQLAGGFVEPRVW